MNVPEGVGLNNNNQILGERVSDVIIRPFHVL